MSAVEFPDVVLWTVNYLRPALRANGYPTVRVADTYEGVPVEVWVQRDGGPQLDQIREAARIRINVFHSGAETGPVDDLARRVSTLMRIAADGEPVVRVEQTSGPSPVPDNLPRRLLAFEVTVRGAAVSLS